MARVSFLQAKQVYPQRMIYQDYLAGTKKLALFYRWYPATEQALLSRAVELASSGNPRVRLSEVLVQYNRQILAGPATIQNARLLAEPQTLAVVTGQQPGFAGGPLYNIYKAVSAIKLAQHLHRTTGRNVVPVFWIASEDANLSEIDRTSWIDRRGQLRQIRVDLPNTGRQISTLRIEQTVLDAFEQLLELMPETEFRACWQQLYKPLAGQPWGQWFGRIYAQLFAEQGLVLLEPHIVYSCAGEIFSRIVAHLPGLQQTFQTNTAALIKQGYPPQISPRSQAILYTTDQGRRQPIIPPDDNYNPSELASLAKEHPERLSCSVMLRPVVQDFLLPTMAYVAGPGEIAYFAQLAGLYKQLDIAMPVIWPRTSMTLAEPNIARLMEKYSLDEHELLCESTPQIPTPDAQADGPAAQPLRQLAEQAKDNLAQLTQKLKAQDISLEKFANKILNRLNRDIDRLLQRGSASANQHQQITQGRLQRIRLSLWPQAQPQERVFPMLAYLVYYGQAILEEIIRQVDVFDFRHRVVYLDFTGPAKQQEQASREHSHEPG